MTNAEERFWSTLTHVGDTPLTHHAAKPSQSRSIVPLPASDIRAHLENLTPPLCHENYEHHEHHKIDRVATSGHGGRPNRSGVGWRQVSSRPRRAGSIRGSTRRTVVLSLLGHHEQYHAQVRPVSRLLVADKRKAESDSKAEASTTTELTHDVAAGDPVAGTANNVDSVASDAEDEEEPEQFLHGAAATRSKKFVRFEGVQLPQADSSSSVSSSSESDSFIAQTIAPQLDNAIARVRVNRDRGLRGISNKPSYTQYTSLAYEEGIEEDEDSQGVNDESIDDVQDHGISTQTFVYGDRARGGSGHAREADEADWAPGGNTGRPTARGRPDKGVERGGAETAAAVSAYTYYRLHIPTWGVNKPQNQHTPRGVARWNLELTVERPFVCSNCSAAFVRREHLKRHELSVHSDQKKHVCQVCGKAFTRGDNLKQHMQQVHEEGCPGDGGRDGGADVAARGICPRSANAMTLWSGGGR
ncbi:hypothetical protein PMIN07_010419 [Paraphaeosphaeria minitans]